MDMIEYCAHDPYTCWKDEMKPESWSCTLTNIVRLGAF